MKGNLLTIKGLVDNVDSTNQTAATPDKKKKLPPFFKVILVND